MTIKDNINTINDMLDGACGRRSFRNKQERLYYELGYLIGLLAKLMHDDSHIRTVIRRKAKSESE